MYSQKVSPNVRILSEATADRNNGITNFELLRKNIFRFANVDRKT